MGLVSLVAHLASLTLLRALTFARALAPMLVPLSLLGGFWIAGRGARLRHTVSWFCINAIATLYFGVVHEVSE